MTTQEAQHLLEDLRRESNNPSEIKIYNQLLHLLQRLESRTFSSDQKQKIAAELEILHLASIQADKQKHFKMALVRLQQFLKNTFRLTTDGHYTQLGVALGACAGVVMGVLFLGHWERSLGMSVGISAGLLIGLLAGRYLDNRAKAAGMTI